VNASPLNYVRIGDMLRISALGAGTKLSIVPF
jgi:hypothetical protein